VYIYFIIKFYIIIVKTREIKNVNHLIFKKLDDINKKPNKELIAKCKPAFEFKQKERNGGLTREQRLEINADNKYFFRKIKRQASCYSLSQWNRDFEQSQSFKKNICEFPCIDFRKLKAEDEKLAKDYDNSVIKDSNNLFKKTKFKSVDLFYEKVKKIDKVVK
jgi:hypothetical protein